MSLSISKYKWFAIIPIVLSFLLFIVRDSQTLTNSSNTLSAIIKGKNVLLLIAHPDDESMFFSPTLSVLVEDAKSTDIMCMSIGDSEGLGAIREKELTSAAKLQNLDPNASCVHAFDHPLLKDDQYTSWNPRLISQLVAYQIKDSNTCFKVPDVIITFDEIGVSSHPNHKSCHEAAKLIKSMHNTTILQLISVPIFRKYSGFIESLMKYACPQCFLKRQHHSYTAVANATSYLNSIKAMIYGHTSQMLWFRWFWILISRYMYINDFVMHYRRAEMSNAAAASLIATDLVRTLQHCYLDDKNTDIYKNSAAIIDILSSETLLARVPVESKAYTDWASRLLSLISRTSPSPSQWLGCMLINITCCDNLASVKADGKSWIIQLNEIVKLNSDSRATIEAIRCAMRILHQCCSNNELLKSIAQPYLPPFLQHLSTVIKSTTKSTNKDCQLIALEAIIELMKLYPSLCRPQYNLFLSTGEQFLINSPVTMDPQISQRLVELYLSTLMILPKKEFQKTAFDRWEILLKALHSNIDIVLDIFKPTNDSSVDVSHRNSTAYMWSSIETIERCFYALKQFFTMDFENTLVVPVSKLVELIIKCLSVLPGSPINENSNSIDQNLTYSILPKLHKWVIELSSLLVEKVRSSYCVYAIDILSRIINLQSKLNHSDAELNAAIYDHLYILLLRMPYLDPEEIYLPSLVVRAITDVHVFLKERSAPRSILLQDESKLSSSSNKRKEGIKDSMISGKNANTFSNGDQRKLSHQIKFLSVFISRASSSVKSNLYQIAILLLLRVLKLKKTGIYLEKASRDIPEYILHLNPTILAQVSPTLTTCLSSSDRLKDSVLHELLIHARLENLVCPLPLDTFWVDADCLIEELRNLHDTTQSFQSSNSDDKQHSIFKVQNPTIDVSNPSKIRKTSESDSLNFGQSETKQFTSVIPERQSIAEDNSPSEDESLPILDDTLDLSDDE